MFDKGAENTRWEESALDGVWKITEPHAGGITLSHPFHKN